MPVMALILLLSAMLSWTAPAAGISKVATHFRVMRQLSFEVAGAHSDIELATDGRALYLVENRANGMVIRRVSLGDGHAGVIAHFASAFVGNVYSVPGERERVILSKQFGDANSERTLSFVDAATGAETPIEFGRLRTDGRVAVSPSGGLFGVGTGYQCEYERRLCHATAYSVLDAVSGREVFSYPLPREDEPVEMEKGETKLPSEGRSVILSVAKSVQKASWMSDDVLALGISGTRPAFAWVVLSRGENGSWTAANRAELVILERRHMLSPIDREIVLGHGSSSFRFRAGDFGGQDLITADDSVVVLKESRIDATTRIDATVLEWRVTQE